MKPKAQVEYRAIAELKELPGNPRTIKKDQFEKLKQSLKDNADYFEARPIILSDRTGELVILAGNQRYKAAKAIGLKEVPTILLPNLTEEREKEIIIRDNVENGDWDWDALANSWDAQDLLDWGVELPKFESTTEIVEDTPPEVNEEESPMTKLGQIWQLGDHRLMVGDSTKTEQVAELMAGEQADLLVTDPPYNVAMKRSATIKNDNLDDWEFALLLESAYKIAKTYATKANQYWWIGFRAWSTLEGVIKNNGEKITNCIVWTKPSIGLGKSGYRYQHELCAFIGNIADKNKSDVWGFERDTSRLHPTMKPVGLIAKAIGDSSRKGELVLDIFGGSGTTMIAAEQLNRRCYMMELDPHYADVIIECWEKFTGQTAKLIKEVQ